VKTAWDNPIRRSSASAASSRLDLRSNGPGQLGLLQRGRKPRSSCRLNKVSSPCATRWGDLVAGTRRFSTRGQTAPSTCGASARLRRRRLSAARSAQGGSTSQTGQFVKNASRAEAQAQRTTPHLPEKAARSRRPACHLARQGCQAGKVAQAIPETRSYFGQRGGYGHSKYGRPGGNVTSGHEAGSRGFVRHPKQRPVRGPSWADRKDRPRFDGRGLIAPSPRARALRSPNSIRRPARGAQHRPFGAKKECSTAPLTFAECTGSTSRRTLTAKGRAPHPHRRRGPGDGGRRRTSHGRGVHARGRGRDTGNGHAGGGGSRAPGGFCRTPLEPSGLQRAAEEAISTGPGLHFRRARPHRRRFGWPSDNAPGGGAGRVFRGGGARLQPGGQGLQPFRQPGASGTHPASRGSFQGAFFTLPPKGR